MSYAKYQNWKTTPLLEEPFISVVIPAQDEEKHILITIDRIASYMSSLGHPWELLVCETGSKDQTINKIKELRYANLTLVQGPSGQAKQVIQKGILAARGRFILFEDTHDSTPVEEVRRLLPKVAREGYDMAIGCRMAAKHTVAKKFSLEQFTQSIKQWILSGVFKLKVHDPACSFHLYSRSTAHRLFKAVTMNGASLQVEVIYLASRFGLRIAEVPVGWVKTNKPNPQSVMKFSQVLADLTRARWNDQNKKYQ